MKHAKAQPSPNLPPLAHVKPSPQVTGGRLGGLVKAWRRRARQEYEQRGYWQLVAERAWDPTREDAASWARIAAAKLYPDPPKLLRKQSLSAIRIEVVRPATHQEDRNPVRQIAKGSSPALTGPPRARLAPPSEPEVDEPQHVAQGEVA
jgi:hypothetical protein